MDFLPEEQEIRISRISAYRRLAFKYGLAMIVLVMNNLTSPIIFSLLIVSPLSFFGAFPGNSDGYYALILLLNELSAYVMPIILLRLLFTHERAEFTADRTYQRFAGESLLLFLAGAAVGSAGSIITNVINVLVDALFGTGEIPDALSGMKPENPFQFGIFMLCICVVAPVSEEFIFRDILLRPLRCFHDGTAVIVSGLIFGLYHGNFDQFAYAALLGIFYSVIAVRANSILPSVLLHVLNNLLVCLSEYMPEALPGTEWLSGTVSFLLSMMLPAGIVALVFVILTKCLSLHSHDRFMTNKDLFRQFAGSPAVLIGLAVMLASFFV